MAAQTESLVVSISEKGALVVKRNIEGIGTGAQKAEGSVRLLRTALGSLLGVAGVAGAVMVFKSAIGTIANFSQQMSTVGAISRATQTQMEDLRATAKDLGITTRFSASQAAEGMVFLSRAGFDTNEVLASIGPTLQLAQAGALGLGEAADIASNVLTGFNIAATESARVIDVLALAANSSNTNVQQLGEAMSYVAPISASLGVSLEQTAAAVEVLSNAGIQASRAGTNLTMVMRLLQSPTEKQKSVLADLGLTADDVSVANLGLTKVLENLLNAGIKAPQVFEYFGRSAASASVLLRGAGGDIQEFTKANQEAQGTAANVAKVMDDNLNGALISVKSAWEGLILAFGDLGAESDLTQGMRGLATVIRALASNLEIATKSIVSFGLAIAAIKFAPLLSNVSNVATAFIEMKRAVAAGNLVLLGSAQAEVQKAAASLATARAATQETAAEIASTQAMRQKLITQNNLNVSSGFRISLMQKSSVLELKQAAQVQALTAAEAKHAVAMKASAAASFSFGGALKAIRTGMAALAVNPLTVGLIALAAAMAAVNIAFDKYKKLQDEIWAAEEAIYKMKLKRAQAQVKEIQDRKAADESLKSYIQSLAEQNEALRHVTDAQEDAVDLTRAMTLAKRPLTEEEIKLITQYHEEEKALQAKNEQVKAENDLLAELLGPQQEYAEREKLLNSLRAQGRISQAVLNDEIEKMQEALGRKMDPNAGYDDYIANLKREIELLSMGNAERQVQQAFDSVKQSLPEGQDLSAGRKEEIRTLVEQKQSVEAVNEAERQRASLIMELQGPQASYNAQMKMLNDIMATNPELADAALAKMAELRSAMGSIEETSNVLAEGAFASLWNNASSALDSFVDTGIFKFRDFAQSVISDITKIAGKMLMLAAFKAMGIPMPSFATGGSFTVGGDGGTDNNLVAFNASRGERVDVLTPAQQSAQAQGQQAAGGASVGVTIINVVDPNEIPAIMASEAGRQATLNTISLNGSTVRQAIS